jgi:uncharacterized protein YraI
MGITSMLTRRMMSTLGGAAAVVALLAATAPAAQAGTLPSDGPVSFTGLQILQKHWPLAPGYRVNVRSGPGTNHAIVRSLAVGTSVPINCQTPGTTETGPYGTSNIWDNIANGQFISDAFVQTGSDGYVEVRCG